MVFKPRQVQDVRIVKFEEILVINIMIVRVKRRQIFCGVISDENCGIPTVVFPIVLGSKFRFKED